MEHAPHRIWKKLMALVLSLVPVSYTHLDVYKRQVGVRLDLPAGGGERLGVRDAGGVEHSVGDCLVHADRASQNAAAYVGDAGQLQQALHSACRLYTSQLVVVVGDVGGKVGGDAVGTDEHFVLGFLLGSCLLYTSRCV